MIFIWNEQTERWLDLLDKAWSVVFWLVFLLRRYSLGYLHHVFDDIALSISTRLNQKHLDEPPPGIQGQLQWSRLSHRSHLVSKPVYIIDYNTTLAGVLQGTLLHGAISTFLSPSRVFFVEVHIKTTTARKLWTRRIWQKATSSIWVCKKLCSSASWFKIW